MGTTAGAAELWRPYHTGRSGSAAPSPRPRAPRRALLSPAPCLVVALAWPLFVSRGPPSYHARVADHLPGCGALLSFVLAADESLPSSGLIDRGLAAGDWKIEGPRRHTGAWPVGHAS